MRPSAFPRDRDAGTVRLYAWVMIVAAALSVGVALQTSQTDPQYSASAEILLDATITPSGSYIQPSMPTEQRVATSTEVVSAAAAQLEITPAQIRERLTVTVPVDTQVLVVAYADDTPEMALSGASSVAEAYVQNRNPADGKNAVATLVGPPEMPTEPMGSNYPVVLAVAVLGGLLTGFVLAWTWDRVRGRVRTVADAERCAGLEALAVPGRLPHGGRGLRGQRASAAHASLDSLAARVLAQVEGGSGSSLLVTGVGSGCGGTTVAVQTAHALARLGRVVFLVTADRGALSGVSSRGGWSDLSVTRPAGLHLVPVAPWDRSGVEAAKLANLLPELHERMPEAVVVIDGPMAWRSAGVALRADNILLVVSVGLSSRAAASAAVQALDHCADKLMGLVVTARIGRVRRVLESIRTWAVLRALRVMAWVAPPEPARPSPQGSSPPTWGLAAAAPRLNGSGPKTTASTSSPDVALMASRWTRPPADEDELVVPGDLDHISADRPGDLESILIPSSAGAAKEVSSR